MIDVMLGDQSDKPASGDSDSESSFERSSSLESLLVKKKGFDDGKGHDYTVSDFDEEDLEDNERLKLLDSIMKKKVVFV